MLDGLLNGILNIFFTLASMVSTIITAPILGLVKAIFPDLDAYLSVALTFWNRVLTGVSFFKQVFLNITGFPAALLNILIVYFFARFSVMITKRSYLFIYNIYLLIRGSK